MTLLDCPTDEKALEQESSNQGVPEQTPTPAPAPADAAPEPGRDVPAADRPLRIEIDPSRLIRNVLIVCLAAEVGIALLDYHIYYGRLVRNPDIRRLFNTSLEDAFPSWVATIQIFLVAMTVWGIWFMERRRGASFARRAGWFTMALFFSWMAFDDGARVHERLGSALGTIGEAPLDKLQTRSWLARLSGAFPSYDWQFFLLPVFVVMGVFVLWFLRRELKQKHAIFLVVAALTCYAFAVELDFFEGLDRDHPLNVYTAISDKWDLGGYTHERFGREPYETLVHFSKVIEECVEMLGTTLLWVVFLGQLSILTQNATIEFPGARATPEVRAKRRAPATRQ